MRELSPVEMAHHVSSPKIHVPASLEVADHVYVRTDAVRQPLVRPYTGPFPVTKKSAKSFTILKNGKPDEVSIDRLKPAYSFENNNKSKVSKQEITQPPVNNRQDPENDEEHRDYRAALMRDLRGQSEVETRVKRKYEKRGEYAGTATTRSGRSSRPPDRL